MTGKHARLDVDYLVKEYRSGRTASDLARQFGVSVPTITTRLKRAGVVVFGQKSRLDPEMILAAYNAGEPATTIANRYGVTHKVVARMITQAGLSLEDRSKRDDVPVPEVLRLFDSGMGARGIADALGCVASTVVRILKANGRKPRDRSEQQFARMARTPAHERRRLAEAAHKAVRGRKKQPAEKAMAAETFQRKGNRRTSKLETQLAEWLAERGLVGVPQEAIGPYNCDIAFHPVAVEVFGGGWHWYGEHAARCEERFRHLMNAGWHVLAIAVRDSFPLTPAVADYVAAYIQEARSNPTRAREYRVVWGAGEFTTGGRLDDDKFSIEPPFTNARDPRTGRYKRVPR